MLEFILFGKLPLTDFFLCQLLLYGLKPLLGFLQGEFGGGNRGALPGPFLVKLGKNLFKREWLDRWLGGNND